MATEVTDCATVLEQFIHDAANLPAEINYMMEEIQAIDQQMQRYLSGIHSKEIALQKQVKNHGSLVPHPKEQEYVDYAKKHYEICTDLQRKKVQHSDKACLMLDRQLKCLDERILQLQRHGQMDEEALPSVFNKKSDNLKVHVDTPTSNIALQAASLSALNVSAHRLNANATPTIRQPVPRAISQVSSASAPAPRASAPATPISAAVQAQKAQTEREQSAGAESKRRKLTMSTSGINMPSQPSSLRQSSIGPGTPKAGTPTGSRAGSIPHQTGPNTKKIGTAATKKLPHQQVAKLKNKHTKHARLSQSGGRKKAGSPSFAHPRSARGGTEASEDSVLSSADASDTDASQTTRRRNKKKQQSHSQPQPEPEEEEEDDGEDEADDKVYCYCSQPSYGEMVGCENPECKREWFHISCLGLKTVPQEEHWFCPECRTELAAELKEGGGSGEKKRKK